MNTPKQLKVSGSATDSTHKQVRLAVFTVLAVHAFVLLALLIEGCRQQPALPKEEVATTNSPPLDQPTNQTVLEPTNAVVLSNNPAPILASTNALASSLAPAVDYTITAGDTFSKLAKSLRTTVKALVAANPDLNPTKLRTGEKIHLPPGIEPTIFAPTKPQSADAATGEQIYTVKSGDWLRKIAGQFGTSVPAIREANGLQTDRIAIGQKLKIPVKPSASAADRIASHG